MIVLLVLLPALIFGSTQHRINWTTCDADKCFPQSTCIKSNQTETDTLAEYLKSKVNLTNEECDVGIQIRYFTEDVALFKLQIIGDDKVLGKTPKLSIYIGAEEYFGCAKDTEGIKLTGKRNIIKKYKIELFEQQSAFESKYVFCAFAMEQTYRFIEEVLTNLEDKRDPVSLQYFPEAESVKYGIQGHSSKAPFEAWKFKCDFYSIKEIPSTSEYKVQPIRNKDKDTLNCESHGTLYTLMSQHGTGIGKEIKELKCKLKPDAENEYQFKIVNTNDTDDTTVEDPDSYYFYCSASMKEVCEKPKSDCIGVKCPVYTPGTKGTPATLTCPGKKWLINGEYLVVTEQAECRQDIYSDKDEVAFFAGDMKLDGAQCFTDYDCKTKSNLNYPDCNDDATCEMDYSNGTMKCRDGLRLRVYKPGANASFFASYYTCNKSSGEWKDETGSSLPGMSQVRCIGEDKFANHVASMTSESLVLSVGAFILGCILFTILTILIIYCYYNPPACFKVKGKKTWYQTTDAGRIAYCQQMFRNVTQATTDTSNRIVHGLKLLVLLLETETVDPKCWEEVFPFLMRVQGTMRYLDTNVTLMLSRYLYLQAKKIIDKNGWTSKKPILYSKNISKKKGLMRAVAIRLLSFALEDKHNGDAKKLLHEGFRKLGFSAIDQYPHCGVMWSVISFCRAHGFKDSQSDNTTSISYTKLAAQLYDIATDPNHFPMPEECIIPEYGTPSEQAALALGGISYFHYTVQNARENIKDYMSGTSRVSYLKGMGVSLIRNPALVLFGSLKVYDEADDKILEAMALVAPEATWIAIFESVLKIMVYYGKALDAKRLQRAFIPSAAQFLELYNQLKVDQQFFEEAAHAQIDELRKWFAANTDLKELKKQPSYVKDPAVIALSSRRKPKKAAAAPAAPTDPVATPAQPAAPQAAAAQPAAPIAAAAAAPALPTT